MIHAMPPFVTSVGSAVCLKIAFHGYTISISCDDSCGAMTRLMRTEIAIFQGKEETDVTACFVGDLKDGHDADALHAIMNRIAQEAS